MSVIHDCVPLHFPALYREKFCLFFVINTLCKTSLLIVIIICFKVVYFRMIPVWFSLIIAKYGGNAQDSLFCFSADRRRSSGELLKISPDFLFFQIGNYPSCKRFILSADTPLMSIARIYFHGSPVPEQAVNAR